ncbi:hypothetical protein JOS77_03895 [Chromobacterium haemolyticum]|nr:hypothetical protein JOS77_03895 [Chromobacterium haemolyticum]
MAALGLGASGTLATTAGAACAVGRAGCRLERAAARQELSCTPEARAALQSARQLLRQWHEQCKLLAQAFSAQEAGRFSSSRPRLEALQLALASGYDLLALHARSYAPLHKGFWRDCHRLYAYALAQGWEGRQAAGGGGGAWA